MQLHFREVRDERNEWKSEKACEGRHPDHDVHLTIAAQIGKAALQAVPHALVEAELLLGIFDVHQRPKHCKEADAVEKEVPCHTEQDHGIAAERRPENARNVELRGV